MLTKSLHTVMNARALVLATYPNASVSRCATGGWALNYGTGTGKSVYGFPTAKAAWGHGARFVVAVARAVQS